MSLQGFGYDDVVYQSQKRYKLISKPAIVDFIVTPLSTH